MIPFLDLSEQYRGLKPDIMKAIETVLDSSQFVLGDAVAQFEQAFAAYVGAKHGIGLNSGTSALHLGLLAAGVRPGDEVITVPHTFVATVAAIGYLGAQAVLVDIDEESYTMDPNQLAEAITPRTRAIMPVHLYGQSSDMEPITEIATRQGIPVIEDAAQAHGASYRGRPCGSLGTLAAFSFYPGKNLGAYGEGGIAVTDDDQIARRLRMLRDWGQERKYHHVVRGFNARMEGIQGAVLGVKLRHLEDWTERRRSRAAIYDRLLGSCAAVRLPRAAPDRRHVYHIYAVRVDDRDGFMAFLRERGVGTAIHYPFPVHLLEGYSDLGYGRGDFPVAERVASEVVSLPMFPELSDAQAEQVAAAVTAWAESR